MRWILVEMFGVIVDFKKRLDKLIDKSLSVTLVDPQYQRQPDQNDVSQT